MGVWVPSSLYGRVLEGAFPYGGVRVTWRWELTTHWLQMVELEVAGLKCQVGAARQAQKGGEGQTGTKQRDLGHYPLT